MLIINGDWFELGKDSVKLWSPYLVREVHLAFDARESEDNGVLANFYPEPPLYIEITSCLADALQRNEARMHLFNLQLFELFAYQDVKFNDMQNMTEMLCYTVNVCLSDIYFHGGHWLRRMQQLSYPQFLFDIIDVIQSCRHSLLQKAGLTADILDEFVGNIVRDNVPYFGGRYEVMRQIDRVRRRYPDVFQRVQGLFMEALKARYPQCREKAIGYANAIFRQFALQDDVMDEHASTATMVQYQALFSSMETENCLQQPHQAVSTHAPAPARHNTPSSVTVRQQRRPVSSHRQTTPSQL